MNTCGLIARLPPLPTSHAKRKPNLTPLACLCQRWILRLIFPTPIHYIGQHCCRTASSATGLGANWCSLERRPAACQEDTCQASSVDSPSTKQSDHVILPHVGEPVATCGAREAYAITRL